MRILLAALCGFALDLFFGDPERLTALDRIVFAHLPRAIAAETSESESP